MYESTWKRLSTVLFILFFFLVPTYESLSIVLLSMLELDV